MGNAGAWAATITSVSAGVQAIVGNRSMSDALKAQTTGIQQGIDVRDKQYKETQGYLNPYTQFGQRAIGKLDQYLGTGEGKFDPNAFTTDPGYQWRLEQGQKALERSAASRGQLLSGGQMKALTNYSQGAASQEFQAAYNRLMGAAGMGMSAAGQQAGLSQQHGMTQGGAYQSKGEAEAAAIMAKYRNWQALDSQAAGAWSGFMGGQKAGYASDKTGKQGGIYGYGDSGGGGNAPGQYYGSGQTGNNGSDGGFNYQDYLNFGNYSGQGMDSSSMSDMFNQAGGESSAGSAIGSWGSWG